MEANAGSRKASTFEKFTLFQKLPTEIRLQIWRTTFPPPRRVELGAVYLQNPLTTKPPHPPVSLFVNQESRRETKRHYDVIHYKHQIRDRNGGEEKSLQWVTFICPERDTLVIDSKVAFFRFLILDAFLAQLAGQLKRGLASIRAVEFTKLNWSMAFLHLFPRLVQQKANIRLAIAKFQGIRTLDFVMLTAKSEQYRQPCTTAVEGFLEMKTDKFGGVPPKVTFIPHTKAQILEA